MKHKLYNRLLSLALALGLVVGMLPGMTFAGAVDSDATALQSQVEQIAEPTEEPETVSEESSQAEATPAPAPESSEEESSQVEETPAPTEEPENTEDTESQLRPAVNFTNAGPLVMPPVTIGLAGATASMFRAPANNAIGNTDNSTGNEPITNENVETTKEVTSIGTEEDPEYQIKLEAYTKGTVSGGSVSVPADIVLVLDESGSMDYYIGSSPVYSSELNQNQTYYMVTDSSYQEITYSSWRRSWGYSYWGSWTSITPTTGPDDKNSRHTQLYESVTTRENAIVNAVNDFLEDIAADNANLPAGVTGHRVGMIGFSDEYINSGWYNSGAHIIRDLTTDLSGISTNTLDTDGGTYIDFGLQLVDDVFNNGAQVVEGEERNRVVVIFTDGSPGSGNGYASDERHAAQAVNTANNIKKSVEAGGCGATVFTVGIFDGADPSDTNSLSNKYMNGMSSNYPNATGNNYNGSINLGTRVEDGDYYLSASNTEALNEIFEKISDSTTSPSVPLGENAQVIDEVTQYFDLPADGAQVTLQVADYLGKDDNGNDLWGQPENARGVTAKIDGQKVVVTGFDFDSNYITEQPKPDTTNDRGRKLIITFTITPDEEFWGGNQVPTNVTESSGVSDSEGTTVENFPVPDPVDVPLNEIDLQDQIYNIYYKGAVPTSDEIHSDVIDFPNDWRTEFVNLTYSPDTTDVDNAQDGTYNLAATLSPKYEGTQSAKNDNATVTVNVFKPVIEWTDSTQETDTQLTEALLNSHKVSEKWMHGNTDSANVTMFEETPPTLIYGFTDANNDSNLVNTSLNAEKHVKVTVKIGDEDITSVVNFEWQAGDGCVGCTDPNEGTPKYQFRIHVGNGDLTIVKQISGGAGPYDNAVFDFKIEAENGMVYYVHLDASSGTAQDTITLPTGEYTVTELDNLNYTPEGAKVQKVTVGGDDATVTFTNTPTPSKIPSDSGATQNLPDWDDNGNLAWLKDEDLDGVADKTDSN